MRIAYKPKRELHIKSKSCKTPRESKSPSPRTINKRQQTSLTIPNCKPQISKNQNKRKSLFLTHFLIYLIFRSSTMLI